MTVYTVKHLYLKTFLVALLTAACLFVPAIIWDEGYFLFLGDFNSQQIPFYMNAHDSIRNGEWAWNWYTDLGTNFIGSYTFYLLGSPFFWLTIPFPSWMVPYLMGPLLILKFACAALISTIYFKNYVRNQSFAMLGGLLYAFSGFSIYNIFFNHFHEPMIFFPLMLIALDDLMDHGRRGGFALAVFLNAMISYFFFVGEVVFIVIYYFVRVFSKGYAKSVSKFFWVLGEALIGFLMSSILIVPSVVMVWQNSRVHNYLSGTSVWFYSNKERIAAIINSFLFPPELPSKQILLTDPGTKWTSLSAYLPIVGVSGALTWAGSRRKHWLSRLLLILLIMALVPGLNSLFVAFNASYYARWFYMFTLMLVLATVLTFDRGIQERLDKVAWRVLFVTLAIVLILALTPQYEDGQFQRLGLYDEEYWQCFVVIAAVAVLSMLVFTQIEPSLRKSPQKFARNTMIAVCIISVLYGNFYIFWGKAHSYDTKNYLIPDCIQGEEKITLPDKDEVIRIDTDDSMINMGMFWKISCMRAFHSVVPASITDFYVYIGEKRDVSSKIPETQYAVRALESVEYYFDRINMSTEFGSTDGTGTTLMPGYSYYGEMAGYNVWKNDYYIPMGFTYDEYVLKSELDTISTDNRAAAMLHAVCLDAQTAAKYRDLLTHSDMVESGYNYNYNTYYADCEERRSETVSNLAKTKMGGLTCTSDFDSARFVFFSIPYDSGWSCYIDGQQVDVERANIGFMAVAVPAGHHEIELVYTTPGLKEGEILSLVGLLLFILYYMISTSVDRKRRIRKAALVQEGKQEIDLPSGNEDTEENIELFQDESSSEDETQERLEEESSSPSDEPEAAGDEPSDSGSDNP